MSVPKHVVPGRLYHVGERIFIDVAVVPGRSIMNLVMRFDPGRVAIYTMAGLNVTGIPAQHFYRAKTQASIQNYSEIQSQTLTKRSQQ